MSRLREMIKEERRRRVPGGDEPIVLIEGWPPIRPTELDQILREIDGTSRGLPSVGISKETQ